MPALISRLFKTISFFKKKRGGGGILSLLSKDDIGVLILFIFG